MTTLLNNFSGGSNGTTITTGNSGGTSGTAFNVAGAGSGGTLQFSNAQATHSPLSCLVATTTANGTSFGWNTAIGTPAQFWFRCYMYWPSLPAAVTRIFTASNTGGTGLARFALNTSGQILTQNSAGATITTSTAVIPAGKWFRIEAMVILSATLGQLQASLYSPQDAPSPVETDTSAATQNTLTGTQQNYLFGPAAGTANQGPFYMAAVGLSTTGPVGPVKTGSSGGVSIVPALVAAGAIA